MDFSELCAAFGALRDRVAELEAREEARTTDREHRGMTTLPPQTEERRATIKEWSRRFPSLNCRAFAIPPVPPHKAEWPKF